MKNIGVVRIITLKQDALKASCSKNFTHNRSALRKHAENSSAARPKQATFS